MSLKAILSKKKEFLEQNINLLSHLQSNVDLFFIYFFYFYAYIRLH